MSRQARQPDCLTRMKILWLECYEKCGCSFGPSPRRELPGYCSRHGNNWKKRYKLPDDGEEKELADEWRAEYLKETP